MNQYQQFPPSSEPPIMYDSLPPPRSSWPKVIGIISIIFGSFGLLCYGCNSAVTIAQPWLAGMVPADQQPVTIQGMQLVFSIFVACGSFLLSLLLLIGGFALTMRKYWSVGALKWWAILRILLAFISTIIGFAYLEETIQQLNDQFAQQSMSMPMTFTNSLMIMSIILGLLMALIWPVFLLIWSARSSVRREIESWAVPMR